MNPKVTVIIPCYNAETFIGECLDSVVNQTLTDIEIICVDDGSTDDTYAILNDYAKNDNRITVLQQINSGAGVARNKGLNIATGEYLAFLDSDDVFEPEMLDKMYKTAQKEDLDIIVCRADRFHNLSKAKENIPWSVREDLLPAKRPFAGTDVSFNFYFTFVWWPWDKLFKRSYINCLGIQFQNLRTTNDLFFVASAVVTAKRIDFIQDVLVHQRIDIKSSLSETREKSWDCFCHALVRVKQYLIDNDLFERFQKDFVNYTLNFSFWHLDTLHGYAYAQLYGALRKKWYKELGLVNRGKDYFYNGKEYERLQSILTTDLEQHLCDRIDDLLARNEKLLNDTEELQNKLEQTRTDLQASQTELQTSQAKLQATRAEVQATRAELQAVVNSKAFKLGTAIAKPWRCLRDTLSQGCKDKAD